MTKEELVQKWIDVTKPISILDFRADMKKGFASTMASFPEQRQMMFDAIDAIDENKLMEIWRTFAEEHFSEDVLAAAVEFFSSQLGQQYTSERSKVRGASMGAIQRHVLEVIRGAGLL